MYSSILVATDGSDPANRAVEHAQGLASTFDATLYAISVVDTRRYGDSMLSESEQVVGGLEERARELLDDVATRSDGSVTTELRSGRPHREIADYAEAVDADLIVLGNRGLGGGEIGSTAERVVRGVDRPALTV